MSTASFGMVDSIPKASYFSKTREPSFSKWAKLGPGYRLIFDEQHVLWAHCSNVAESAARRPDELACHMAATRPKSCDKSSP